MCDSATVQQSQLHAFPAARVSSPRVQGHALPSGINFIPHWRRARNCLCFSDGIPRESDLTNEFTKRREFENLLNVLPLTDYKILELRQTIIPSERFWCNRLQLPSNACASLKPACFSMRYSFPELQLSKRWVTSSRTLALVVLFCREVAIPLERKEKREKTN